ncbi:LysE family transporter [uncultured Methanoregula sp.]|uniref:LysE family transporter n=1 Tax=uncultured Methanoregula sp. TaxID=1005933 RepID=UPI002AAAD7A7|nr:LysE family transporter [uncultured Methanoregula sp.]
MYDIISMLVLGFVIGLTGALAPGPTLVATINSSLSGSWTAGLKISLGHILAELVIFLLIVFGLATIARPYTTVIALVGGSALIVFGLLTILGSRTASLDQKCASPQGNPVVAGLVSSAANPYFWIWWLSVGSAMVIAGLEGGFLLAAVFMIGHWMADTGWFTLVAACVSKGVSVLNDTLYHRIMAVCGLFLIAFGLYYIVRIFFPA